MGHCCCLLYELVKKKAACLAANRQSQRACASMIEMHLLLMQ